MLGRVKAQARASDLGQLDSLRMVEEQSQKCNELRRRLAARLDTATLRRQSRTARAVSCHCFDNAKCLRASLVQATRTIAELRQQLASADKSREAQAVRLHQLTQVHTFKLQSCSTGLKCCAACISRHAVVDHTEQGRLLMKQSRSLCSCCSEE